MWGGRFFSGLPLFLACPSPSADKPSNVTARKQAHPTKTDDFFIHSTPSKCEEIIEENATLKVDVSTRA